jgi:CheY-like chemotaxis protein
MPKILVVDDDQDFRESMRAFLKASAYTVVEAADGREGLRLALAERPNVILMDIVMTERTEGFFTIQQIRDTEEIKDTAVFVVSSLYSQIPGFSIQPECDWLEHDEFFPKPVDMPKLLTTIGMYVRGEAAGRRHVPAGGQGQ